MAAIRMEQISDTVGELLTALHNALPKVQADVSVLCSRVTTASRIELSECKPDPSVHWYYVHAAGEPSIKLLRKGNSFVAKECTDKRQRALTLGSGPAMRRLSAALKFRAEQALNCTCTRIVDQLPEILADANSSSRIRDIGAESSPFRLKMGGEYDLLGLNSDIPRCIRNAEALVFMCGDIRIEAEKNAAGECTSRVEAKSQGDEYGLRDIYNYETVFGYDGEKARGIYEAIEAWIEKHP